MPAFNEESFIALMRDKAGSMPAGITGIGDDAAILPLGDGKVQVITTDLLIEDVHFLRDQINPFDLGAKCLHVNLSDVAAMGAKPKQAFLSVAFPKELSADWLESFADGLTKAAAENQVLILGGDTNRSPGPVVVNLLLIGEALVQNVKRRSTAGASDLLFVASPLGDSGAGLKVLLENLSREGVGQTLVDRHHRPKAQVLEGQWLGIRPEVTAMLDLSDGLAKDIGRLLQSSQVGVELNLDLLPTSPELRALCQRENWDPVALAASGGEDYVLMFTVKAEAADDFCRAYAKQFGKTPTQIGRLTKDLQRRALQNGVEVSFPTAAFEHFSQTP